jgi:hypothetical protein
MGLKVGDTQQATANHASAASGDFTFTYDDTKVTTLTKLKAALDSILASGRGSSFFTP